MNTWQFPDRLVIPGRLFLITFIITGVLTQPVLAQTEQGADTAHDSDEPVLEEVVVTGIRTSLDLAADIKRESDSVVDAITAQDIGLFSDNNIGEALARVPGVLLEREAGEGYRISIRGLGPRFVRTTINGRTALSASGGETGGGDDARGFTFNIMPSEVISRAQVSKSTQARDIEGGIGGTVDLLTNRPLDFKPGSDDFYISGALRGTYNDLSEDYRSRVTVFLNKKFADKFGLFFGMTLDEADRIDNLAESQRLRTYEGEFEEGALYNGVPLDGQTAMPLSIFSGIRYQEQPIERDRETYVTGFQWRGDNTEIYLDWTNGSEQETRDDKRFWYNWGDLVRRFDNRFTSLTVDTGDENLDISDPTYGSLVAHEFAGATGSRIEPLANGLYRHIPRMSHINVGGLNVEWSNDDWTVNGDIGYAHQKTERELERLRTRLDRGLDRFDDGVSGAYDIHSYGYPIALLYDSLGEEVDPNDISHQYIEQLRRTLTWEDAEDFSFRLDFGKLLGGGRADDSIVDEVLFGITWNEMQFTRDQVQKIHADPGMFDINQVGIVHATGILPDVTAPGFKHAFVVSDINDPVFEDWLLDPDGYYSQQSGQFDVTEDNIAFYLQGNFSGGDNIPYRGNLGIRYVDTRQSNLGWVGEGEGDDFVPADPDNPRVETSRSYDYWLPSFNLVFDIADDKALRFAANKALTRPDPIDMSSRIEIDDLDDDEDLTGSGGNPDLEPYTTISFDALLEWYPGFGGFYAIGFFYKDLESYIASGSSAEMVPIANEAGEIEYVEYEIDRPVNTDGGQIWGLEVQWHLPFDFADNFLQYFGLNGSYTYVDAEMDAVVPDRGTPISLRGTSEYSGNLIVYFEKEKFGARLAANYRSDYLFQEASDTDRFDEWTEGRTILDFNFDYLISDKLTIRFTANNLTGENRSRFWYTPGGYYSDERDNGQEYVLELRFASDYDF